jgi:hypothetical protein
MVAALHNPLAGPDLATKAVGLWPTGEQRRDLGPLKDEPLVMLTV